MMDEDAINSFISEINSEITTLRSIQNDMVKLTSDQEADIKRHKKSERGEIRKKYLAKADEAIRAWVYGQIDSLKQKIKASGLPEKTKEELGRTLERVTDNNIKVAPEISFEINRIKDEENAEKTPVEEEKEQHSFVGTVALAAASAVVATVATTAIKPELQPEEEQVTVCSMDTICGIPAISEKADPVYAEKAIAVGEKAIKKIEKEIKKVQAQAEPLTLDKIHRAKNVSNAAKKYAKAAFLEEHPEIKKDLQVQETAVKDVAVAKAIERYQRKMAKKANEQKVLLSESKTAGTVDRTTALHDAKNNPQKKEKIKVENKRPNYSPKEAIVMKKVKKIKESAGVALTPTEIMERLNNPTLCRIYDEYVRKQHPEYFLNQTKEEERKEKIAQARLHRKLEQKRKEAEVKKEKGTITAEEKKTIEKEVNEEFNGSLKKLLTHCNAPKTNVVLQSQNVHMRTAS